MLFYTLNSLKLRQQGDVCQGSCHIFQFIFILMAVAPKNWTMG